MGVEVFDLIDEPDANANEDSSSFDVFDVTVEHPVVIDTEN